MNDNTKRMLKNRVKHPWAAALHYRYDLILGDDLDSYIGCKLLEKTYGCKIKYFYDFKNFYTIGEDSDNEIAVGVDMALTKGKCIDNHLSLFNREKYNPQDFPVGFYNTESINPNNVNNILVSNYQEYFELTNEEMSKIVNKPAVSTIEYTSKFNLNATLLTYAFFASKLPENDEGKALLLCPDSVYKNYYDNTMWFNQYIGQYQKLYPWQKTHIKWMQDLGFDELLEIEESKEAKYFSDLVMILNLKSKINIDGNKLVTQLDIETIDKLLGFTGGLPKEKLSLLYAGDNRRISFEKHNKTDYLNELNKKYDRENELLISGAFTRSNEYKYTVLLPGWHDKKWIFK